MGGGHSHIQVLKTFGMRPQPGVRLTVVSREVLSPYSGMLPGYVAGLYEQEDIHFDLSRLAMFAEARLIADEVVGLDLDSRQIMLASHPPLRFDLLSLNTGGVPVGVSEHVIPVKPIGRFLPRWAEVKSQLRPQQKIVVVGGGPGGVELAMAMRSSLPVPVSISIVCEDLLANLPEPAANRVRSVLADLDIAVVEEFRVVSATAMALSAADGRTEESDHVFWVTGVCAATFPRAAGVATDEQGFVIVDEFLRSVSHPDVFAAGDVASLLGQQRPKSGVFAVREGPVLAENLRRALLGKRLRRFRAQQQFLILIGTGNRRAIASKGQFSAQGRWVWWWKDWIDRRFMARFNRLPEMRAVPTPLPRKLQADAPDPLRCGGCGAKLGASPLLRVLARLPDQAFSQVALGIGDDAAIIHTAGPVVLTVDGFRSFISDPYLFGRIAAHHSLNDVLAMGGRGVSALALAVVPLMAETMMEEDLFQMLTGAVHVLNAHDVPLVGGHSAEGAELSLSLTITGTLDGQPALMKSSLSEGQALVVTKALGTGTTLAAHMRGCLGAEDLRCALLSMDSSNAAAMTALRAHGVSAVTDISGFGLAGHLSEMLRGSGVGAQINVSSLPALPGAMAALASNVSSSLQPNNLQALDDFDVALPLTEPSVQLLADPQTSGGLLAGVPADRADGCVAQLRANGYPQAAIIGETTAGTWRIV